MNDEMPWVNLTQKEVDELRKQKHTLTEYGKEKLRKMMNNYIPDDDVIEEMVNVKLTEEKKEELERLRKQQDK